MNRGLSRVAQLRTSGALVARVAAIHRLQREHVFAAQRKEHPKSGPSGPVPPLGKGSAAFRRPTPDGSFAAASVPTRSR
jgi:hypothetical protein